MATNKTSKRGLWNKLGRYVTVVTLACFFLPFFGVSCEGVDVITISGADMVGGCRPGGLITEAEDQASAHGGGRASMKSEINVDKVDREPLAIVALLLAVVVAGLAWLRTRQALLASMVLSVACLGALVGLYVKVNGEISSEVSKEMEKKKSGDRVMKDINIDAGSRFGFWLTAFGLIGVATMTGLALREKEGAGPPLG